jgi:hypothetical protein
LKFLYDGCFFRNSNNLPVHVYIGLILMLLLTPSPNDTLLIREKELSISIKFLIRKPDSILFKSSIVFMPPKNIRIVRYPEIHRLL